MLKFPCQTYEVLFAKVESHRNVIAELIHLEDIYLEKQKAMGWLKKVALQVKNSIPVCWPNCLQKPGEMSLEMQHNLYPGCVA